MQKLLLSILFFSLLVACDGGKRQTEKALNVGNYDQVIFNTLKRLNTNKDSKRKQGFIILLQDAFNKVTERNLRSIESFKKITTQNFINLFMKPMSV